jgi:phosphatidate phosphatase APP1
VYKKPNVSNQTLNSLANVFLVGTSIDQLQASEQDQARNLTAEIFVVQQANQSVLMNLQPQSGSSNVTQGGSQVVLPYRTTDEGDFDVFVPIQSNGLVPGNQTQAIQTINVYANGSDVGNATAYLVPPTGMTVVSDIDDILRVTRIYLPKEGILNTFARPYTPWLNMPDVYANWSRSIPNLHFHYLTTTPEQITANYMDFIYKTYPLGSFDTRPLNFSDVDATLSIRKYLLIKMFESFPQRKFVLVADTSNSDVMKDYPLMATMYPEQVQCILLRNTSATDQDYFPYDTSGFKNLSQSQFMFFIQPDDLTRLDIVGGNCYNASIKQNLTFSTQDELLGIHKSAGATKTSGWAARVLIVLCGAFLLI